MCNDAEQRQAEAVLEGLSYEFHVGQKVWFGQRKAVVTQMITKELAESRGLYGYDCYVSAQQRNSTSFSIHSFPVGFRELRPRDDD